MNALIRDRDMIPGTQRPLGRQPGPGRFGVRRRRSNVSLSGLTVVDESDLQPRMTELEYAADLAKNVPAVCIL